MQKFSTPLAIVIAAAMVCWTFRLEINIDGGTVKTVNRLDGSISWCGYVPAKKSWLCFTAPNITTGASFQPLEG